ncbi:MAG: response regulator [Deltaproteobacteria bacterium]|nr:response regulator [Deltaproteobacteria bacterium]
MIPQRWIPETVRGRLMVVLALVVIATSSTVAMVSIAVGSSAARSSFEESATALARQFAASARVGLAVALSSELTAALEDLDANPSITGGAFFDSAGTLLAQRWRTGPDPSTTDLAPLARRALETRDAVIREIPGRYRVVVPRYNTPVIPEPTDPAALFPKGASDGTGAVLLEFSTDALEHVERRIQFLTMSLTLVLSIAGPRRTQARRPHRSALRELAHRVGRGPLALRDSEAGPTEPRELVALRTAIHQAQRDSDYHLRALEDSERRARSVFDSAQDGMAIVAPGGVIVNANPALRKQLGTRVRPNARCLGSRGCSAPPSRSNRRWHGRWRRDRPKSRASSSRGTAGRSGKARLILSRLGIPETPLTLVVFRDHSERLREEDRRRYLEEQLRHSQKLEALGVMAGGIAHDFNNQLNIILGNLVLLWQDLGSQHPSQPLLEDLELATRRCIELTQGLLTFTRRERAKIRPFGLRALIEETLRLLRRTFPSTIQIDWTCEEAPLNVLGEPSQIQQVFMNLCINAADAMPSGGHLRISCGLRTVDEEEAQSHAGALPGRYVALTVEDTGTGMDAATLDKAFDPFFTTKPPGRGTGLGLSTAFGIVRSHGGWLEASSRLGEGTVLRMHLPLTGEVAADDVSAAREIRGGTETILIAEDDPRLRDLTCAMLMRHGYEPLAARDGDEALALYDANRDSIRLLILDLVMPNMGGGAVLRRLRSCDDPIPVILTTGYETSQELANLLDEHSALFLAKPYSPGRHSRTACARRSTVGRSGRRADRTSPSRRRPATEPSAHGATRSPPRRPRGAPSEIGQLGLSPAP